MNSGKFLSGVIIGAAAGALAGILFASGKGSKLRKKVRRQSEDLKERLNCIVDEMVEKYELAADKAEKVKKAVL